jgi:hypothetical protein
MKPIILDYQIRRTEISQPATERYYDHQKGLTVIAGDNGGKPLIEVCTAAINDTTSTRKMREQNDFDSFTVLNTTTKVGGESSDRSFDLLELKTKTFTKTESDDDRFTDY